MFEKYKSVLYHGTISQIEHIDVKRGRGNKDFGKGFYMAVSKQQIRSGWILFCCAERTAACRMTTIW